MIAKGYDARTATIKAMEEITGPILAITLVLCSVFVPCCFIGGITGQFFRQFAVTIAVSTIISAINALTMTPSRAVMIFKTEEGARRSRVQARGAAVVGLRRLGGCWPSGMGRDAGRDRSWPAGWSSGGGLVSGGPAVRMFWTRPPISLPGDLSADCRLVDHPAGERRAGLAVPGLQPRLRRGDRGLRLDRRQVLRLSVVVLLVYGGLLVLTYWVFQRAPPGFIPQQDQGRLIVNVQLPDSASLQRTKEAMASGRADRTRNAGRGPHGRPSRECRSCSQANSSNFGSMFIVLDPFDERQDPESATPGDHGPAAQGVQHGGSRMREVTVLNSSPIPGLGVAGGFKIIVEDRGGLGLAASSSRPTS